MHTEAIRTAIDTYQGRLIRFAARITGDLESGRDVVQDTFLRLCRQDLEPIADHLAAWLFRVCRNRALDVRKKERPMVQLAQAATEPTDPGAGPDRLVERDDLSRRALAALAELSPAQQEVLVLRFQEEMSYREIAEVTGRSVSSVGVLIHVGLQRVRTALGVHSNAPQGGGGRLDG